MKKVLMVFSALVALTISAQAQDTFYPGWNLGVQGGANYVTSNYWGSTIPYGKHITPNAQISLGYDFAPWFGLRGSVSGPLGTYPANNSTEVGKYGYLQHVPL